MESSYDLRPERLQEMVSGKIEYKKKKEENKTDIEIFEHKIYFEWFGDGDIKLDETSTEIAKKVTIYITPTPDDLNPDPPDPPGGPPPY